MPHGSAWVHRQAKHFLREEFSQVANSPVLYQLDKAHLIDCLKSNFLQSSELEVLQAVLKWGEHELIKRMEDRGTIFFKRDHRNVKLLLIIYLIDFRTKFGQSNNTFCKPKRSKKTRFK